MSFINLDAANYDGHPIASGRVPGATAWSITGHIENIQIADTPVVIGDLKANYAFLLAPASFEIVSSSPNDTSGGTGAQTVLVETLDSNYNVLTNIVTLNGVTPVAIPGGAVHFRTNNLQVLTAGTGLVNAGNITLRVAGGGATQEYILAGVGIKRTMKYTVPINKRLIIDNFYFNPNGSGASKTLASDFIVKLPSGPELVTQRNFFLTDTPPIGLTLPTGITFDAGTSLINKISSVSSNGVNFALSLSGVLVPTN